MVECGTRYGEDGERKGKERYTQAIWGRSGGIVASRGALMTQASPASTWREYARRVSQCITNEYASFDIQDTTAG